MIYPHQMAGGRLTISITHVHTGQNNIGMVAWHLNVKTPMHPHGREVIAIANDISFQAGTFGVLEDLLFQLASEYARQRRIPRIYLSANSGARIGLADVRVNRLSANGRCVMIDAGVLST